MSEYRPTGRADRAHAFTPAVPFVLERLEYSLGDGLLRVALRLSVQPPTRPAPELLAEHRSEVQLCYAPMLGCASRVLTEDSAQSRDEEWRWRGAFPIPADVACDPLTRLRLRVRG